MHTKPTEKNFQATPEFNDMMEMWSIFRDQDGGKEFSMEAYLENHHQLEPLDAVATAHRVRIQTKHLKELYVKHRWAAVTEIPTNRPYSTEPSQDPTLTGWGCFQRFHQIIVRFYRKIQVVPTQQELAQAKERQERAEARAKEEAERQEKRAERARERAQRERTRWVAKLEKSSAGQQLEMNLA